MPFKPGTQGHRSPRLQQRVWQAVAARLAEQGCDGDQRAQRRLTPRPVFQSASPAPSPPLPDRPCDTAESASKACSQPRRAPARALLLTSTGSPGPGAVLPSPAPQACVGGGGRCVASEHVRYSDVLLPLNSRTWGAGSFRPQDRPRWALPQVTEPPAAEWRVG